MDKLSLIYKSAGYPFSGSGMSARTGAGVQYSNQNTYSESRSNSRRQFEQPHRFNRETSA